MDNITPSEELMARIAEGDEDAFEILVNRHQTSVLNLIYRFIGDRTQAKDLAQEVFMRVWQAVGSDQPKAEFTTWILRNVEPRQSRWRPFNRIPAAPETAGIPRVPCGVT